MKILNLIEDNHPSSKSRIDILKISVQFDNGNTGISYMYRATYQLKMFQQELIEKYDISKDDIEKLNNLFEDSSYAEHFFDYAP